MLNLEPIKARLAAATPGPWELGDACEDASRRIVSGAGLIIATPRSWEGHYDAELIAHAPGDLAALVAEVERLRSEMEDDFETLDFVRWKMRQMKAKLKRADEVENKSADLINRLENKIDKLEDAIYCHKLNCKESRSEDEKLWKVLKDA